MDLVGLEEVGDLMKGLQIYGTEVQQSSSTVPSQSTLAHSIAQISKDFSGDLDVLRGILPDDLSPSLSRRMNFVLQKTATNKVLQRLERRKSTATLTLEIIGR